MEFYAVADKPMSPQEFERELLENKNVIYAINLKRADLVSEILQSVGDNKEVITNQYPLHQAAQYGTVEIVTILLNWGIGIDSQNKSGLTPIQIAIKHGKYDIFTLLLSKGANVNTDGYLGKTALHAAAKTEDSRFLTDILLKVKEVSINAVDYQGQTPLHIAAHYNEYDNMKILIDNGADKTLGDHGGKTALDYNKILQDQRSIALLQF